MAIHSKSLVEALDRLSQMDDAHLELGAEMLRAHGGALYGMDLLAVGALNRSKAQISGFRTMLEARNMICAGALLRLQLDTALRFFASFIVDEPHTFALDILAGKQVRDLHSHDGKRMTDAYLVRRLGATHEWVPRVYERTSGYVHLSSNHLMSAIFPNEDAKGKVERRFTMKVSDEDKPLPEEIYIEAADAFCAATDILLKYVHGWAFTKANPHLAARERAKQINPRDLSNRKDG